MDHLLEIPSSFIDTTTNPSTATIDQILGTPSSFISAASNPTTMDRFPEFPLEIYRMVYRCMLPPPHLIADLHVEPIDSIYEPPPVLGFCKESAKKL